MANTLIRLLGKFQLQGDSQIVEGFRSKKVQELFCYLMIYREQPRAREALASLLWGDTTTENSKKYFRQALWMLQSSLAEIISPDTAPLLLVEEDWLQVNPKAEFWLDVAIFEQAYQGVLGIATNRLTEKHIEDLRQAVDLYRGDLMDGCYHDWCLFERERLQGIYQKMLYTLTDYYELHQEYEQGLSYAQRILACDHACEHTHRLMMRLYYYSGDRTQALRQYRACEEALSAELDVKPSQKTIELYEQIREDTLPIPPRISLNSPDKTELLNPEKLADTLVQMQRLQQTLIDMHDQLQSEISAIEKVLEAPLPSGH